MEHIDFDNLGGILKAARKSRKLTREKVAESVGISLRYLSALEKFEDFDGERWVILND